MRGYRIEIGGDTPAVYTSVVSGATDPNALHVEFDIPAYNFSTPMGFPLVRIWGVSLETISQAKDFNLAPIKIFGGMQKGLPLANPKQYGLLTSGFIMQAFGNWIGTNMTLDLIIASDGGASSSDPKNITLNWTAGQEMGAAITQTLKTAYPDYTSEVHIRANIVLPADETGIYETIEQFASYVQETSKTIVGGDYVGVQITLTGTVFLIFDGSAEKDPVVLDFADLIGQPTWIEAPAIQFNTVMRADLQVGSYIKFPPGAIATNTAASLSQARDKSAFQGVFFVQQMRHVGAFRQPDAVSWISTFNAYPLLAADA